MNDFTKCSNNNLITPLIMNIGAKFATYIEKSLIICYCQADKFDCSDLSDIYNISKKVVSS